MAVNKVILLGNLGKDPELNFTTTSNTPVCRLSIATGEKRKDASGQYVEHTEWHNVIAFGKTAENCAKYLGKGRQVYIEGRLQTRKWQDKQGADRYTTEIIVSVVQFIGGNARAEAPAESTAPSKPLVGELQTADQLAATKQSELFMDDEDLPW